ncbi:MAG TPA: CHAT domain-containing protein [Pyrinomonadaceae bacterium]
MYKYEDLKLGIRTNNSNLLVTAESSTNGSFAQEVTEFQVASIINDFRHIVNRRLSEPNEIRKLGTRLFEGLFPNSIYDLYIMTLKYLASTNKRLRISIYIEDRTLAAIPWELVFDKKRKSFLSLDPQVSIIRIWPSEQAPTVIAPDEVVRILAVFSNPADLPRLDPRHEYRLLKESLEIPIRRGRVELTIMGGPVTLNRLADALHSGEFHVLHFTGHGTFNRETQRGGLFFENEEGKASIVEADRLHVLFTNRGLRMVSIIAGESASTAGEGDHQGLVTSIAEAGVPVVLGFQGTVTNNSALKFVRALYSTLADGLSIGSAMTEARQAIWTIEPNSIDWAMPVLYANAGALDLALLSPSKSSQEGQAPVRVGQSISSVGGEVITGDSNFIRVTQQVHNVRVGGEVSGVVVQQGKDEEDNKEVSQVERGTQIKPGETQMYITALKSAIMREPTLSTGERINKIAQLEELRFMLLAPTLDSEGISKTIKNLSATSPGTATILEQIQRQLHL